MFLISLLFNHKEIIVHVDGAFIESLKHWGDGGLLSMKEDRSRIRHRSFFEIKVLTRRFVAFSGLQQG